MSQPGAEKDQAGREFEALLAALPRKSSAAQPRTVTVNPRAPLGNAEFETLLNEFRSLSNPPPSAGVTKTPASPTKKSANGFRSPPAPESLVEMLEAFACERDRLVSRREAIHDEAALKAIEGIDRLTTNLQIALMRDQPDKILLLRSIGQHFALPLADVSRTLGRNEVEIDEKKGVCTGEDWLPVHFLGASRSRKEVSVPTPVHGHIVIAAGPDGALALCVESVVGVVSATLAPLGDILQGAQGLKGVAITGGGMHALVLDVNRLAREA